jgi:hypothetical protein
MVILLTFAADRARPFSYLYCGQGDPAQEIADSGSRRCASSAAAPRLARGKAGGVA